MKCVVEERGGVADKFDRQFSEERGRAREVWCEALEEGPCSFNVEGLESSDVWNNQNECIIEVCCVSMLVEGEFQR